MFEELAKIRRVVTGTDADGRSKVMSDGAPPVKAPQMGSGRAYINLWVWERAPLALEPEADPGALDYHFPGPKKGGHVRVVQANSPPPGASDARDTVPLHEVKLVPPGGMWDRGGSNAFTSPMHKTQTVDYAVLLAGERVLVLDDQELPMKPGDTVVQVGAFHRWASPRRTGLMGFDMISADFIDGDQGLAQGRDAPMRAGPEFKLPPGIEPVRRIVTIDREPGVSCVVSDGPSPDVRFDPARPGFASTRLWVAESTPAPIVMETLHLPHTIEPPPTGSVFRMLTIPPDDDWRGKVGRREAEMFFASMGSPNAARYSASAPHPYMQQTNTVDFCFVVKGTPILHLDKGAMPLNAGDTVVQRGSSHAWGNRSQTPAVVAICSHDAAGGTG